jgi:AraC family transcriptional regulator
MLRYLANGYRQLDGEFPPTVRANWEIQAVLDGRLAPVFVRGERPALQEKTLWVFTPDNAHGWYAPAEHRFHRVSFHFGAVPQQLEHLVRSHGTYLSRPLSESECVRLKAIAVELEPHFRNPTTLSPLVFQARLLDLAVLILGEHQARQLPTLAELAAFKVESALSWYSGNLCRRPSAAEMAAAVHVSTSHLRRLFRQVHQMSPKEAMQKLRLDRAMELLGQTSMTLDEVAHECGFASASHLCREHIARHGITPTSWRKTVVAPFPQDLPAPAIPQTA